MPPAIVISGFGPSGGASAASPAKDEIAGNETTAAIKGEHMFVDMYRELFELEGAGARLQQVRAR